MVFNSETGVVTRVIPKNDEIMFQCRSESFMEIQGEILFLSRNDHDKCFKLIRYSEAGNKITVVRNFGRF